MPSKRTKPRPKRAASRHPRRAPIGRSETAAVKRLRAICLALPEATEKIAWGEPTWRAGKIFAQMDTHHHGADHVAVWLPARPGVQEGLVEEDPVQFFRPPYVGHLGLIGVRIDRKPDWRVVAGLVADAYREVAAPRGAPRVGSEQVEARVARELDSLVGASLAQRKERRHSNDAETSRPPDVTTSMIYTHILNRDQGAVRSPLDSLAAKGATQRPPRTERALSPYAAVTRSLHPLYQRPETSVRRSPLERPRCRIR